MELFFGLVFLNVVYFLIREYLVLFDLLDQKHTSRIEYQICAVHSSKLFSSQRLM